MITAYDIYLKVGEEAYKGQIQNAIAYLDRYKAKSEDIRNLMISLLAKKHSRRSEVVRQLVEENSSICKKDIRYVLSICEKLEALEKEDFNKCIVIINSERLANISWRSVNYDIEVLTRIGVENIGYNVLKRVDYSKPLIIELLEKSSGIVVKCEVCGAELTARDIGKRRLNCESCRERAKASKNKKNGVRETLFSEAARRSIESLSDRIRK